MKCAVRYYSRSGNTKKVALAIAKGANVEALDVSHPLDSDVDVLFLCNAVYAYGVDSKIKEFINGINVKVGKVVNVSTTALLKSTYPQISKLLEKKGIPLAIEEYSCKGKFLNLHKERPNDEDLKKAEEFAKKVVSN